ncbi:S24 family peptidase [Paludisphaera mucosa]|uniref:S24 family peptidase n=1 Tax=Paludisphaera mucosa TaxID=3030827 RepID=A0ABT6FAA2_9BACT|nr:S24 family peptidase [Paludisphaera mucosa]MDG3004406.1 S24 family peptidase [Paludisphaera mucosa]
MARRKTLPDSLRAKLELAERLAILRLELFGERGGPEMARRLGIPVRTWYNYEGGVTVPAEVVLKIIELTAVEPTWLLHGKGPKFRPSTRHDRGDGPAQPTVMVGALLRTALQLLEGEASPELGSATARFLESERSLTTGERDVKGLGSASRHDHDTLRAERGRGEREWLEARREGRCLAVPDDAMEPVLARGASVAFAKDDEESLTSLDGRMVVAWVDGVAMVRWFQDRGDHALLRAEDSGERAVRIELDADGKSPVVQVRRILWIEAVH